ncbi:hypothetical protein RCL1_004525 [Eukaryota sp. TZLM3-RCL]
MTIDEDIELRHELADLARSFQWSDVIALLEYHPNLINSTRPKGQSKFTPLHQAAFGCAPMRVVKKLIQMGASINSKNAEGDTAFDIAVHRKASPEVVDLLRPITPLELKFLPQLQTQLHMLMYERVGSLLSNVDFILPDLVELRSSGKLTKTYGDCFIPVPGMHGGFALFLIETPEDTLKLRSFSFNRVVGGSEQQHEISIDGYHSITST